MMPMMTIKKASVLNINTFKLSSSSETVAVRLDMSVSLADIYKVLRRYPLMIGILAEKEKVVLKNDLTVLAGGR